MAIATPRSSPRALLPCRKLMATAALHALLFKTALVHRAGRYGELLLISYAAAAAGGHQSPDLSRQLCNFFAANGGDPSQWNAVVSSLSRKGLAFPAAGVLPAALRLGLAPDSYTLCSALSASADAGFVRQLHCYARKSGWLTSVFVGGALIDAYSNSGSLVAAARQAFEEMPTTNVACANALLSGYRRCGAEGSREALALVRRMAATGLVPDGVTLSILLRICAEVPAARLGAEAHAYSLRRSRGGDAFVASALVDMYGRCGSVEKARLVFNAAEGRRDVVLWTSMLDAYSRNGRFEGVIGTFQGMVASSVEPDEVAFVTVLSACARTGDVARGLGFFESMTRNYRIAPWPEHCACVMDLLCRAGELEKAARFAGAEMSRGGGGSSSMWGALLSACRAQGNVEMGEFAAARAVEMDPLNLGVYVEMSNLYAAAGRWEEMEKLREGIKCKDLASSRFMATA